MLLNCFTKKLEDPNEIITKIPQKTDVPNNTDSQPNKPKKDLASGGSTRPMVGQGKVQEPRKDGNSTIVDELKEKLLERNLTWSEKPSRIPKREVTPVTLSVPRKVSNVSAASDRVIDSCTALDWMERKCLEDSSKKGKKLVKRRLERDSDGFSSSSSKSSAGRRKVVSTKVRSADAKQRWLRSMELLRANKQDMGWKSEDKRKDSEEFCGLPLCKQEVGIKKSESAQDKPKNLEEFCGFPLNKKEAGLKKSESAQDKHKALEEFCGFPLNRKEAGLKKSQSAQDKPKNLEEFCGLPLNRKEVCLMKSESVQDKHKASEEFCGLPLNRKEVGPKKSEKAEDKLKILAEFCGLPLNKKEVGLRKLERAEYKPKDLEEFCGLPLKKKEVGLAKKDTTTKKPQQERICYDNSAALKETADRKANDNSSLSENPECPLNTCFVGSPRKDPYMKKSVSSKVASIRDSQNISHLDASKKFASARRRLQNMQKELAEKENQFFKAEEEFLLSKCILDQTRDSGLATTPQQEDLHTKLHNLPEAWIQLTLQFSESRRRIIEWLLRNQVRIESSFYEKETDELRRNVELTKSRSNEQIHEVFKMISSLTEDSQSKLRILESQDGAKGGPMADREGQQSNRGKDGQKPESPGNKDKFEEAALKEMEKIKMKKSAQDERATKNKIRSINNRIRHLEKVASSLLHQKRIEKGSKLKKNPELLGVIKKTAEDKQKHMDKLSAMMEVMEKNVSKAEHHRSKVEDRIKAINEKVKKRDKMCWACI